MFKWLDRRLGLDGSIVRDGEHVVCITPFDTFYIKVGSETAKNQFPKYYSSKT